MAAIHNGDYVRLPCRERPHEDSPTEWWRVTGVDDVFVDVVREVPMVGGGTRVVEGRWGVLVANVRAHRPAAVSA